MKKLFAIAALSLLSAVSYADDINGTVHCYNGATPETSTAEAPKATFADINGRHDALTAYRANVEYNGYRCTVTTHLTQGKGTYDGTVSLPLARPYGEGLPGFNDPALGSTMYFYRPDAKEPFANVSFESAADMLRIVEKYSTKRGFIGSIAKTEVSYKNNDVSIHVTAVFQL